MNMHLELPFSWVQHFLLNCMAFTVHPRAIMRDDEISRHGFSYAFLLPGAPLFARLD
jgi:hypothetical protein